MYVFGPLIAFGVIAALGAILRWAFDSDIAQTEARVFNSDEAADYGLLSIAGVVETEADAHALQGMLSDAGIRSTTAHAGAGRVRVLVFSSELEKARRLVGGSAI
jgi:hypothetical protein